MPTEWDALVKETAEKLARINTERSTIQSELAEIRELLGGGKRAEAPRGAPASSAGAPAASAAAGEPPELPPDEMAFLRSLITPEISSKAVAGPPQSSPKAPPPLVVNESAPLLDPERRGRETPALSMNVPGSEDIVIRSEKDGKTLKCAECGAMNVPTEWYCESCGSELATD
jgi:hypothetical protein